MESHDITIGQVIRIPSDQGCYRILWSEPAPGRSYWIRLDNKENIPRAFDFENLKASLSDGSAEYAADIWSPSPSYGAPSAKAAQTRDRLWEAIREAAQREPDIYDPGFPQSRQVLGSIQRFLQEERPAQKRRGPRQEAHPG